MPTNSVGDIFVDNLKKLLRDNNMTCRELAEKLEVRASSVSMWMSGKSLPRMGLLDKIADLFDVSIDYLLTGESKENECKKPHYIHAIAAHFDGTEYTEEELEEIRRFAEFLKSKRNT